MEDERITITRPRSYRLIAKKFGCTEADARKQYKIKSFKKRSEGVQTTLM